MGRPTSHDRDVRGPGNSVFRREVAGTGSVGDSGRFSGPRRSGGGGGRSPLSFLVVIIIAVISLVSGNKTGLLNTILGTFTGGSYSSGGANSPQINLPSLSSTLGNTVASSISGVSAGWSGVADNRGKLNKAVNENAREKFYRPTGGDSVTVMVYMCGTDLE